MLTQNVVSFLNTAHTDRHLAEQIRNADTYEILVELAKRTDRGPKSNT